MKHILILLSLVLCFGSANGQEEVFESEYFLGANAGTTIDELKKMELNCLHIEEVIKGYLFYSEQTEFERSLKVSESNKLYEIFFDLNIQGQEKDNLKKQIDALTREQKSLQVDLDRSVEVIEYYLLIYTALCK